MYHIPSTSTHSHTIPLIYNPSLHVLFTSSMNSIFRRLCWCSTGVYLIPFTYRLPLGNTPLPPPPLAYTHPSILGILHSILHPLIHALQRIYTISYIYTTSLIFHPISSTSLLITSGADGEHLTDGGNSEAAGSSSEAAGGVVTMAGVDMQGVHRRTRRLRYGGDIC